MPEPVTLRAWFELIVGGSLVLAPFVSALVGVIKSAAHGRIADAYWPMVSILVGVVLAEFAAWIVPFGWREAMMVGGVAGLSASGAYAAAKAIDRAMP